MYYLDYPKMKIGEGNPYYCCRDCGISEPAINGELDGHQDWCKWRKEKESDLIPENIESWTISTEDLGNEMFLPTECVCKGGKRYKITLKFTEIKG